MNAPSFEIGNCDVFDAKITSSRQTASRRRRTSAFASISSITLSITWSASAAAVSRLVEPVDPRQHLGRLPARLLEPALDPLQAALDRGLVDLDDRHVEAGRGDDLRDPAPHQPASADDDNTLNGHARSSALVSRAPVSAVSVIFGASVMPACSSSLVICSRSLNFWIFVPDIGHSSTKRT